MSIIDFNDNFNIMLFDLDEQYRITCNFNVDFDKLVDINNLDKSVTYCDRLLQHFKFILLALEENEKYIDELNHVAARLESDPLFKKICQDYYHNRDIITKLLNRNIRNTSELMNEVEFVYNTVCDMCYLNTSKNDIKKCL